MYTISNNYKKEIIIKNSRFIALLYKIGDASDVSSILDKIKIEYPDATHYCYGYATGSTKKGSDDGEPSGTAGVPILKVIEANNLDNVLCVVVRYFGGIKLGANGLIRAYTKAVASGIQEAGIKELISGMLIQITFNYDRIKEVDYLLKDVTINDKQFDSLVTYMVSVPKEFENALTSNKLDYRIIKDIYIEK